MRLHLLKRHLLLLALACSSSPAWSAISGTVFRDYNSNGAQGTFEPGIGGMTITAFGLSGTTCGSAVVSANGTYSIPISAIANCTAAPVAATYRLELDPATIPATVGQSFQGAGNLSTLRFAADASTGVGFALNNPSQFFPDYQIIPGRGQFADGRHGDSEWFYLTARHADRDEGASDMLTIGPCCNSDFAQGPEKFIDSPPEALGGQAVLWYVPQLKNATEAGKENCWARSELQAGVYQVHAYPCTGGPLFALKP